MKKPSRVEFTQKRKQHVRQKWRNYDGYTEAEVLKQDRGKQITAKIIYNMDQTVLYYTKLTNRKFSNKKNANNMKYTKQNNSKERVTIRFFTCASGDKFPLSMFGK